MTKRKGRANPQERRSSIIENAIGMFAELGFHGLTVHGLADRCGMSGAGLLYYFKSKEDLLLAVLDTIETRESAAVMPLIEAVEQAQGEPALAWQSIVELMRQMFRRSVADPVITRFVLLLQAESLEVGHVAHDWFRNREQLALELLTQLLTPYIGEPVSNSRHIMALMQGLAQQWLRQARGFDVAAEWDKALEPVLSRGRLAGGMS